MIIDYDEFRANMKAGTDKSTEKLMFLKKARPFTFSQYEERYQKEKKRLRT
ncbi:hypothetical protein [Petralouisia muris]|jgi:hypothetical protein|uniref:hypothetical protein n=1 Tax=Petralouisia muris TaxID=3032872 RepID=UPI001440F9C5|nr:hypothetical protein [Petralouisia muris]